MSLQIERVVSDKITDYGHPRPDHFWLRFEGVKLMWEINRIRRSAVLYVEKRPASLGEIGTLDCFLAENFSVLEKKTNYFKVRRFEIPGQRNNYRVETYQYPDQPIGAEKMVRLVRPIDSTGLIVAHYYDNALKNFPPNPLELTFRA